MTRQFGRESVTRDRSTDARTLVAGAYGISQRRVRDAQRLQRDVPNLFEKVRSGEVRLTVARREAERDAKRRRHQELSQSVAARQESRTWNIITGDTIETMRQMKAESVRLIFADPVYNIGVDYGRGTGADRLPEADYLGWCRDWLTECQRLLSDDGSLWVLINDDYADHFGLLLRKTGLHRRAWIKWYETFGVNCTNNFNCCSRHLYYHVKHPRRFVFDSDAVSRPSDRQSKYADKRAAPHGKLWDNVWCIPRLVENSRERLPDFPTQLPLELVRPIVQCASEPGDLVLDPFAGSGTTGVAAIEGGRQFIGIELNPQFAKAARQRLMVAASQQKPSNSMKSEKRRAA